MVIGKKLVKNIVVKEHFFRLCNSYTMGCLPVHGDNPRALASVLSYITGGQTWYNDVNTCQVH